MLFDYIATSLLIFVLLTITWLCIKHVMFLKSCIVLGLLILILIVTEQTIKIPVQNASSRDWNDKTFWYYPWGNSVVHRGVDIFSDEGTSILANVSCLSLFQGKINIGGNVLFCIDRSFRIHYYAHMDRVNRFNLFSVIKTSEQIGTVGTSGNAKGKSPHLHYSIISLVPRFWLIDLDKLGWMKMFYLDPTELMES